MFDDDDLFDLTDDPFEWDMLLDDDEFCLLYTSPSPRDA